ncbi:hypothetical protein [Mycolicibacterium conceptionense]|uniref:hypothetical protein n=1 Tax=Mycolicibacterium conceptionense TaxID=451644 RepID=UPI000AF6662A|nr:hypothetical protein [Mycolicibacterium conceptionense]
MQYTVINRVTGELVYVEADSEDGAFDVLRTDHYTPEVAAALSREDFAISEGWSYKGY